MNSPNWPAPNVWVFIAQLVEHCSANTEAMGLNPVGVPKFFGGVNLQLINPLSPSIHVQILQTDLHTFPLRINWENLIKHQGFFSFMIIFYILTTLSLDNVWTLLGENCCWSLLGLKGLNIAITTAMIISSLKIYINGAKH